MRQTTSTVTFASFLTAALVLAFLLTPGECRAEETKTIRVVIVDSPQNKEVTEVTIGLNAQLRGKNDYKRGQPIILEQGRPQTVELSLTVPNPDNVDNYYISILAMSKQNPGKYEAAASPELIPDNAATVSLSYDWVQGQDGPQPVINTFATTKISLDKILKYKAVKESNLIRVPVGVIERKKEEYTIKHTVSLLNGWKGEAEIKGELKGKWVFMEGTIGFGIRNQIERSETRTYEESKTTSREVEIKGGNAPVKLVWLETYRTGKAVTIIDGKEYVVPFEFREGWDLQVREGME